MPENSNRNWTRTILIAALGGMLALSGELMPDDFKDKIQNGVWNTLHISFFWVWLGFIVLLTGLLLWLENQKDTPESTPSVSQSDFEAKRDEILLSFMRRYSKRYNEKLDNRITLDLELSYTQQGTDKKVVDMYFAEEARKEGKLQQKLAEAVQKFRYLLIIGQPGAGKTTLLLDAALALLDIAKTQGMPMPVIFNLSSWRKDSPDFAAWLVDMLVEGNGFSRKLAQEAIDKNHIAPLLDGLDELGLSLSDENERVVLRGQCLKAIKQYLQAKEPEFVVICSRIGEYKAVKENASVKAEILVNPLRVEQLENVLKPLAEKPFLEAKRLFTNPTAAQNMLHLLKAIPSVKTTFCVPFYFHLATQVFDSQSLDTHIPKKRAEFEAYLVKTFVEKKLSSGKSKMFGEVDKNRHWLGWLAVKLNEAEMTWFELVFFQPNFLRSGQINFAIRIFNSILFSFIGYLFFGTFLSSVISATIGFLYNLIILGGLISIFSLLGLIKLGIPGFLLAFICSSIFFTAFKELYYIESKIRTADKRVWNINFFTLQFWIEEKENVLFILGISFLLFLGYLKTKWIYSIFNNPLWNFMIFLENLTIVFMIICFFVAARIITKLFKQISFIVPFIQTNKPYQRLTRGFFFKFYQNIIILFLFSNFFKTYIPIYYSVNFFSLIFIVSLILAFSYYPLFRHLILRLHLFYENKIPLRLVHFLTYATDDLRFLECDGGSWRFRHQILQDYFANFERK